MNTLRLVGCVLLHTILLSLSSDAAFAQAAAFTATPSPVPPGQTVTFNGNSETVSHVKVTLWFYNSAGKYVGSASKTGLNFTAGQPTPVTITYATSSGLAVGTNSVKLRGNAVPIEERVNSAATSSSFFLPKRSILKATRPQPRRRLLAAISVCESVSAN